MAVQIVKELYSVHTAEITVAAPTQEEVLSSAARDMVIKSAAGRLSRPGFSSSAVPAPVDADGNTTQDVLFGRTPVAAYHGIYKLAGMP